MINFLKGVFVDREYVVEPLQESNSDFKSLFIRSDIEKDRTEFYLLIQPTSNTNILADDLLVNRLSELTGELEIRYPTVSKNCTVVLCLQTGVMNNHQILKFEEDPYGFKKNVILYTPEQLTNLLNEVSNNKFTDEYVSSLVFYNEGELFDSYKNDSISSDSFYSLLMMLITKLPIITYQREQLQLENLEGNIHSVLDEEQRRIKDICLNTNILDLDGESIENAIDQWELNNEL